MSYKNYLLESVKIPEFNFKIYRGFKDRPNIGDIIRPRTDRKPRDTATVVHNAVSAAMKRKFGFGRDSCLFASTDKSVTEQYGDVYVIEPVDITSKIYQNPGVGDFTMALNEPLVEYGVELVEETLNDLDEKYDLENYVINGLRPHLQDYYDALINNQSTEEFTKPYYLKELENDYKLAEEIIKNIFGTMTHSFNATLEGLVDSYVDSIYEVKPGSKDPGDFELMLVGPWKVVAEA